jgi:8-oxo-dGTP diphosphatase
MVLLAGTAIIKEKKILLIQSADGDQKGKWGPPAGHAEEGENPQQVAIRETKEETGLDVEIKGLIQVGAFNYKEKDYIAVFYLAEAKDLSKLKLQKEEVSDHVWASLDDLKNNKYPFRKKFLLKPLIKALKEKPVDTTSFEIYKLEP